MQHARRMRHSFICGLSRSSKHFFSHYTINGRHFEKKTFNIHNACVLIFSTTLSETLLILTRNEQDIIKNYIGLHVQYRLFFFDFNET